MTAAEPADEPDDEGDLGALFTLHLPRLVVYFLRCQCGADADDLATDVMFNFIRYRQRYPSVVIGNVDAFLRKIARHRFADYVKQKQVERSWLIPLPEPRDGDDWDDDEQVSARARERPEGSDIEAMSVQLIGDIWDGVEEALDGTDDPELNLKIIRLAVAGYTYAEIVERLGVKLARVRNVMNRMRLKLAKQHPEWTEGRRLPGPPRGTPREGSDAATDPDPDAEVDSSGGGDADGDGDGDGDTPAEPPGN